MNYVNQDDFLRDLLNDFRIEAKEHHQAIVSGLLELEKSIDTSVVELVFREIHSLKGAARAVNLTAIEQLCMNLENVFQKIKKGNLQLLPEMFDTLYHAADTLQILLNEVDSDQKTVSQNTLTHIAFQLNTFSSIQTSKPPAPSQIEVAGKAKPTTEFRNLQPPAIPKRATLPDKEETTGYSKENQALSTETGTAETVKIINRDNETVRVDTAKLYRLLAQAEEMISFKTALDYQSEQISSIASQFNFWRKKNVESILTAGSMELMNNAVIHEFCHHQKDFLKKSEAELFRVRDNLTSLHRAAARSIDDILVTVKQTLMYPFSSILSVVPRIVRDLSKEFNKEITYSVSGADIEIDRRILEEMKDPLIHLIRNCIDHGIESREQRAKSNKPQQGTLSIAISQIMGQKIEIRISDDGVGINKTKLIESAIKNGILKKNEVSGLSDGEINKLVFTSGVSTSPFITDVSGRGLGMAIVAEKVEKIGGSIEIESEQGKGTTFVILLPQTLSAFRGILIKSSGQFFMIPTVSVLSAVRIGPKDIKTVESKQVVTYNKEPLSLVNLAQILGLPQRSNPKEMESHLTGLVLYSSHKKMIFLVDGIYGEKEGVVKDLGPQLKHVRNIAGTTLLGDGRLIPVLQVQDLMESASQSKSFVGTEAVASESQRKEPASILVVEDSITVRNMLRNLLEASGFAVKTAVDGLDGLNQIKSGNFDLVVSDIEMPRMNGFELTSTIRQEARFADLPVILVSTLDSADDRQRGMNAGANAYIVKGSFEKSNLLETINQLI